jgi:hypothetical protein
MGWAVHVARMGEDRNVLGFGGKARRKEATRKTEAKMGEYWIREIGWGWTGHWIQLAQDRDQWRAPANTVMNVLVLVPRS